MASQKRQHDSQSQDSQGSKYRCHQILPMTFGLNNSYGKLLQIGLENTSAGSGDFNPVVRLSNHEQYYGMSLPLDAWVQFREQFDEIERFFHAYSEEELLDHRISIPGFTIRFMISFSDRAFELCEDDCGEAKAKRVRKLSLVFKRVTFDRLKSLAKIIDYRIKYLLKVKEAVAVIVKEIGEYSKEKLMSSENAQYTYFTANNVQSAMRDFDEAFVEKIDKILKDKNIHILLEDIHIIIYEFINLHLYNVVLYLNSTIYKDQTS